ncbi:MAG: DNA repair protein RadA [Armatimonadota bacterium]|nr:DNA repair protein RadA [Armatimonadota bacterium]MCX7778206.1 DNA repair protein RadA [Armatimonadota bacterium]MDW8025679.1 DNA repair protein RadA [Armatimonadota bacterium]
MPKLRSKFICQECGFQSEQWLGRCPECSSYNSFVEELVGSASDERKLDITLRQKAEPITAIVKRGFVRERSGIDEIDRVLGGGVVRGSTVLLGGEPGIGKSTLMLQMLHSFLSIDKERSALYVAAEESIEQIAMRADRLKVASPSIMILPDTDVTLVCEEIERLKPSIVVVDSIQAMVHPELVSAAGSVSQVRECASELVRMAKVTGTSIFMIGHVTKEGVIAGPKVLEHMIDTVLYMEGDQHYALRLLRVTKNRFGPVGEVGLFKMTEDGLEPVTNPSEYLLSGSQVETSGNMAAAVIEGKRPLLLEVQALVAPTYFGAPRRLVTGMDYNRACILIAVLERRADVRLGDQDVYINVAGGIRVTESALDLPAALAIASSRYDVVIPRGVAAFGEVGLGGEVRPVPLPERRLLEMERLGFKTCFGPLYPNGGRFGGELKGLSYIAVRQVGEAISKLLGLGSSGEWRHRRKGIASAKRGDKSSAGTEDA